MQIIRKNLLVITILFFFTSTCIGQSELMLKKPKVYITSAYSVGISLSGYFYSNSIKGLSISDAGSITTNDLSTFDRKAVDNYSLAARDWSDVSLLTTAALPNFFSLHKVVRRDFLPYNIIYGQALLSTLGQVMFLKGIIKKKRPFVYNTSVPIAERIENDARFSFPSGHTAIAATASYFFATTYSLYFPESKNKKWVWLGAAVLPMLTGYLRYRAGKHFVSDIAGGYVIGAANGVVFPLLFRVGK